jgi:hypothetical protein
MTCFEEKEKKDFEAKMIEKTKENNLIFIEDTNSKYIMKFIYNKEDNNDIQI